MTEALLQVDDLSKRFGGVVASEVDHVRRAGRRTARGDRSERRRQDHADRPAGRARSPDVGQRPLRRQRHHRAADLPPQPARAGALVPDHLAVSRFHRARQRRARRAGAQRPLVPVLARCAARGRAARARARRRWRGSASRQRADVLVSNLSHGEHRQLEIAMALATRPRMLLLDEPMAGMGPEETARMVATLRELKRELTILLIEHDMEAVFALADRITVLVYGRIIASGDARGDPRQRGGAAGLSRRTGGGPWLAIRCSSSTASRPATA